MPALLSAVVDRTGDGLRDGELVAVVTIGVVEMTDAVFVAPPVVPLRKACGEKKKVNAAFCC